MLENNLPLFNAAKGRELADQGIAQALTNSGEWKELAMIELEQIWLARRHEANEFTFEMLKFPVVRAVGNPHSENCWGGLAQKMVKKEWIICTGTSQAKSVSGHSSLRRKYKWSAL